MRHLMSALILLSLCACGMETATTALAVGAVKKHEIEEGHKSMAKVQVKLGEATALAEQHTKDAEGAAR